LCTTSPQTIWPVAPKRPSRSTRTLCAIIATAVGHPTMRTVFNPGCLIKRSTLLFVAATTPLCLALSPLPSHVLSHLKLRASSLRAIWRYCAYFIYCKYLWIWFSCTSQIMSNLFCLNSSSVSVPSPPISAFNLSYKMLCVLFKN